MKRFMTTILTSGVATTIALATLTSTAQADPPEKLLPTLKRFDFAALAVPIGTPPFFSTDITLDGDAHTIDFERVSVFAPNAKIVVVGENGEREELAPMAPNTYRGTVRALPDSVVTAALEDDGLHAIIRMPDRTQRAVTPLDGMGVHAVYRNTDVETEPMICEQPPVNPAWEQFMQQQPKPEFRAPQIEPGLAGGGGNSQYTALLGIDCDYEYYQDFGSDVRDVEGEVGKIINNVNPTYESDTNITHLISIIVVRTSSNDPYTSTLGSTINTEHRDEWLANFQGDPYDLSLLMTDKDSFFLENGSPNFGLLGRALKLGAVCDRGEAFCFSEQVDSDVTQAQVVAHELGHLWNGRHCDSDMTSNCIGVGSCLLMCSSINGCDNNDTVDFATCNAQRVIAYRNTQSCFGPGTTDVQYVKWRGCGIFCSEDGDLESPHNTVGEGVAETAAGGTVIILGGQSSQAGGDENFPLTLNKLITLRAFTGSPATIGQ